MPGQTDAALENYRKGLALATKPGSGEDFAWIEIKGMADARIGDALLAEEKREEALASYHESLATRERLTMINPVDSKWRLDLFMSLVKLAEAGDTPRAQYGRALTILRALDEIESSALLAGSGADPSRSEHLVRQPGADPAGGEGGNHQCKRTGQEAEG